MPTPSDITALLALLQAYGPSVGLLAIFLVAALRGWIVFKPQVDFMMTQFVDKQERLEQAIAVGEKATELAEQSHKLAQETFARLMETYQQQQQLLELQRVTQAQISDTQRLLQQVQLELVRRQS